MAKFELRTELFPDDRVPTDDGCCPNSSKNLSQQQHLKGFPTGLALNRKDFSGRGE